MNAVGELANLKEVWDRADAGNARAVRLFGTQLLTVLVDLDR